jgi:hypothetical protein
MDANVDHKTGKTIKTMVSDPALGMEGVNNLSSIPILQNPDGPFVKWTVANYANQVNDNQSDKNYNYPNSNWDTAGSVTPYGGTANDTYINRTVRNLAADYVKYTHTSGSGSLVVYLKDVDEWDKIVVNAVRLNATGTFVDVQQISGQTVSGGKKYIVPGVYGTDYTSAVIVVTNIKDTIDDSYKEDYQIKAKVE